MTGKRWIAVLAVAGLVAAACGDDDDDDGGAATDTTEEAGAATTAATEETSADTGAATTAAESTDTTTGDTGGTETTAGEEIDPASIETDIGVDDSTIKVGMLADLSGAFAPLVTEIVEAQEVFWDKVNEEGGIAGRQIELLVEDNAYDVATQLEKYEILRDQVAIFSQSTGSPHTSAIAQSLVDDELVAIPLSWYSGWPDPEFGQNVFESYTTYCIESMNGIEWLAANRDVQTVALISFPGEYGGDGDAGARMAIEELGLEIVYDGAGQVTPPSADNPNPDQSAVTSQIVSSGADLVWATINPATLSAIMAGAVGQGYTGIWSGNSPTYSFKLLGTELAPLLDEYFIASTYIVTWGTDVPGMQEVVDAMSAGRPELNTSDVFILGWTEGQITKTILEQAAANGDMTRAGILEAARQVEVQFDGLAPDQTWSSDDPNENLVRESYIYDVTLDAYNPIPLGEGLGSTGWELLEGPYTGEVATNYTYDGPCFEPQG
jgi:ABC-type branched-subunit amino acid transport system substrate-binding protein